jgi:hypothetical protein
LVVTSSQPFGLYKKYLWSHIDLLLSDIIDRSDWFLCNLGPSAVRSLP